MKLDWKRCMALLLAVCSLFSLAACGSEEEKPGKSDETASGTVFVPQYLPLGASQDGLDLYRNLLKADGIYATRYNMDETAPGINLIRLNPETREETVLAPLAQEGSGYLQQLCSGKDGSIWYSIADSKPVYTDGFDPEAAGNEEELWDNVVGYRSTAVWHKLAPDGTEQDVVDISSLQETLGLDYFPDVVIDEAVNFYLTYSDENGQQKLAVFDRDLHKLFEKELTYGGNMLRLSDGSIGLIGYGENGMTLSVIDLAKKDLGKVYALNDYVNGDLLPGCGDYLFFYSDEHHLYGWAPDAEAPSPLLDWNKVDVSPDSVRGVFLPQEGVIHLLTSSYSENDAVEYVILTETPADQAPKIETLRLGMLYTDQRIRRKVNSFNRHNDKAVRIEMVDYSGESADNDYTAVLQKMNTEILSGKGPDLFVVQGMPLSRLTANGLIEDLWPFIDGDPELGRDKLMVRPLELSSIDGKLPQIFDSFSIITMIGAEKLVGDRTGWTLQDAREALAKLPEGATLMGTMTPKNGLLQNLLMRFASDYMNWSTGECRFDSPEFVELLQFCNDNAIYTTWEEFPENIEYPSMVAALQNGEQLVTDFYMADLKELQLYRAIFGGELAFPGFPTPDGSNGSAFLCNNGLAMSAKCKNKEAAWAFMRTFLQPSNNEYDNWGFPINQEGFDALMKKLMTKQYELDDKGQPVLDENGEKVEASQGGWGMDNINVDIYAVPQKDYDMLMQLYQEIDSSIVQDTDSFQIIMDEAAPFFAGKVTAEAAAQQIQSRMNIYVNEQR